MKVFFSKSIVLLSLLSLLAGAAHAQNQDNGAFSNRKFLYGIHLGVTNNEFDLYSTHGGLIASQDGTLHTDGSNRYEYGFRFAVIGEARLGRCFSLRVMPGVSLYSTLRMERVRGELPVDVKFNPFRWGKVEPYLTSGLGYAYDFATLRDDSHKPFNFKPLNAHDLRYTCGLGVDWYTRLVKVGLEMKAGFGLLPPDTDGVSHSSNTYFHVGPTFSIGLNIEV